MSESDNYLEFAKELAEEAGKIMVRYFRAEDIGTQLKEDKTPITLADTKINDLVIKKVQQKFPDQGVIGEEASLNIDDKLVWVVDPIDGTAPFSVGVPVSTFSLALVDRADGQAILGIIYDPFLKHLYSAVRGKGAFLNDRKIKTSSVTSIGNQYLSVLGSKRQQRFNGGHCIDLAGKRGANVFSLISQAYSAAKVASGDFAGSIFGYGSPWDSAAAALIVEEAGGVVTDIHGQKRRYDDWGEGCVLGANSHILDELLQLISQSSTDKGV